MILDDLRWSWISMSAPLQTSQDPILSICILQDVSLKLPTYSALVPREVFHHQIVSRVSWPIPHRLQQIMFCSHLWLEMKTRCVSHTIQETVVHSLDPFFKCVERVLAFKVPFAQLKLRVRHKAMARLVIRYAALLASWRTRWAACNSRNV